MQVFQSTLFIHDGVQMINYKNEPLLVGDFTHNRIEFFHLSHKKWYAASPYPYENKLFGYAAVWRQDKVFIIGGCGGNERILSRLATFENDEWLTIGYLQQSRMNFLAIQYGTDLLIFGGMTSISQP